MFLFDFIHISPFHINVATCERSNRKAEFIIFIFVVPWVSGYYCGRKYPISCFYSMSFEDTAEFWGNSMIPELKSCTSLDWISRDSFFRDSVIVAFSDLKILIPNTVELLCIQIWFSSVSISCKDASTALNTLLCSTSNTHWTCVRPWDMTLGAYQQHVLVPCADKSCRICSNGHLKAEKYMTITVFQMTS